MPLASTGRWPAAIGTALVAAGALAARRRAGLALLAGGGLIGTQLSRYALDALRHESRLRRAQHRHDQDALRRLARAEVTDRAHDPLTLIRNALDDAAVPARQRAGLDRALGELHRIALAAGDGRDGLAPHLERQDGPLDLFGSEDKAAWAPPVLRRGLSRAGSWLDEIRLLHTRRIEEAALLYTLSSRALIVVLAPWIERAGWAASARERSRAADAIWAATAAWSASIALAAPEAAALVLARDEAGARARRMLLRIEVPLALGAAALRPSWPVTVFAVGWTNYWQRPGPAFYPKRLAAFLAAIAGAQRVGLARAHVRPARSAAELLAAVAALGLTGSSYGAMAPLSVVAAWRLLARRDREERAAAYAHEVLVAAQAEVEALAAQLAAAGDAAAAAALRMQAQVIGEGPPAVSRSLPELIQRAVASGSSRLTVARPTFSRRDLRAATVRSQDEADALAEAVAGCHAEAARHGRGRVLTDVRLAGGRLVITVENEIDPERSPRFGAGRRLLATRVQRLPGGDVAEPGAVIESGPHAGMWRVRFECDARILDLP